MEASENATVVASSPNMLLCQSLSNLVLTNLERFSSSACTKFVAELTKSLRPSDWRHSIASQPEKGRKLQCTSGCHVSIGAGVDKYP